MRILGIETSCDDTGISVYDEKLGLLINKLSAQSSVHNLYGGVVPELASRIHLEKIFFLMEKLSELKNFSFNSIDAIAYTAGPGLIGSLLVGATVGCSLAYSLNIPTIAVNHIEGHLLSPKLNNAQLKFPFLGLLISGGNTQLIYAKNLGNYELLGKSLDISIGNLFDKIAKLLGLKYPGGPEISKLSKFGNPRKFIFPKPMKFEGLNFSFSGLETFIKNIIQSSSQDFQTKSDIALALEESIIDIFINKCKRAMEMTQQKTLVVVGGVSSNYRLRTNFIKFMKKINGNLFLPDINFCTDNAAMIAYVGLLKLKSGAFSSNKHIIVNQKWPIENMNFF